MLFYFLLFNIDFLILGKIEIIVLKKGNTNIYVYIKEKENLLRLNFTIRILSNSIIFLSITNILKNVQ